MNKINLFILILLLSTAISFAADITPQEYYSPVDISGKILDQSGNLFTDKVMLKIDVDTTYYNKEEESGFSIKNYKYQQEVIGGYFNWKGKALTIEVSAEKEGFHSTLVRPLYSKKIDMITSNDIFIYMIPKGKPSTLEYTKDAYIPDKEEKASNGKECGWSLKKRWYFPVGEGEQVDIIWGITQEGKSAYIIEEPGGFVLFPGYPQFESQPDNIVNSFDYMPEAPESGYVQTFKPSEHKATENGFIYCYFRTPGGKCGKMRFHGVEFDYYLQPDGSRDLELGEQVDKYPINPIEADRHKHLH